MRKSQSEGMLCLEGKQVKALGKSCVAGLQLGKKLDLFSLNHPSSGCF